MDIVVFDDEAFLCQEFVDLVRDLCLQHDHLDITVHGFTTYETCAEGIMQLKPTIAFLDIVDRNDEDAGFRLAKLFRSACAYGHVVFVTGFSGKQGLALQDLIRPSGFLTKPVVRHELQRLLENIAFTYADETTILVRKGGRSERLRVEDIIYVERIRRKLMVYTASRCCEITGTIEGTMQALSARSPHFLQVDRGIIVNIMHVQCAQFGQQRVLQMSNDALVNFAESHIPELKQKLEKYS